MYIVGVVIIIRVWDTVQVHVQLVDQHVFEVHTVCGEADGREKED